MGKQQLVMAAVALGILGACGTYGDGPRNQGAGGETVDAAKVTEQIQPGYAAFFGFDSATLDSEADAAIAAAIAAAKEGGSGEILLSGHTDQAGAADYNMKLAQRRVDAVAARLQAAGLAPAMIKTAVHGESQPKAVDKGEAAQNRRVDIAFVQQVEAAKTPRRKGAAPISFDLGSWLF